MDRQIDIYMYREIDSYIYIEIDRQMDNNNIIYLIKIKP